MGFGALPVWVEAVAAVVLVGLAAVGLTLWVEATGFSGPTSDNDPTGYGTTHFWGLVLFTFTATIGVSLCQVFVNLLCGVARGVARFLWGSACLALAATAGATWGSKLLSCGVVACLDTAKYPRDNNAPEFVGWQAAVAVVTLISVGSVGLVNIISTAYDIFTRRLSVPLPDASTALLDKPMSYRLLPRVVALVVFSGFLFCVFFLTSYLPNEPHKFVPSTIAKGAATSLAPTACFPHTNVTCPELPEAWFVTKAVNLSDHLYLNLFPSNIFFFAYLALMALASTLMWMSGTPRITWLTRTHAFAGMRFTWAALAGYAVTIAFLALFSIYWIHDHNFKGYYSARRRLYLTNVERWARAVGQLAVALMSLALFPVPRRSVVHRLLGVSWESFIRIHRILGRLTLAAMAVHAGLWWVHFDDKDAFPRLLFQVPFRMPTGESQDNFTIPLVVVCSAVALLFLGVFSLSYFRRKFFEVFYYTHTVAAYALIPAVLYHGAASWEYMVPSLTLWLIDRIGRLYASQREYEVLKMEPIGRNFTKIAFTPNSGATFSFIPGQYVFVNIPEISLLEWHPFSIASPFLEGQPLLEIYVRKVGGENSWTSRLYDLAKACSAGDVAVSLRVDGPYGTPINVEASEDDSTCVLLACAGIGITPCASIFRSYADVDGLHLGLLWVCREESIVDEIELMSTRTARCCVHVTGPLSAGSPYSAGRPDLQRALLAFVPFNARRITLFVCGPPPFVEDAFVVAQDNQWHFHSETFAV